MYNMRCSVCDWNAMGLCDNYEVDKWVGKGQANAVVFDHDRKIFICLKCLGAINLCKYSHIVSEPMMDDEKEAFLLLEDFSDEEIDELDKPPVKDTLD